MSSHPTTEPVTLEQKDILHILRNPWGKTEDEKRRARLEGADEIERLQRSYECAHAQAMENGTRALQAVHERDCAVEDVKRLLEAIRLYVRSKKADHGRNALDWWRLQEIEKESAADVSQPQTEKNNGEG